MIGLLAALFVAGDAKAGVLQAKENLKYAEDTGFAKKELAKALWLDQDQEGAFKVFLEALAESITEEKLFDPKEDTVYQEALALYLNHPPEKTALISREIKARYFETSQSNPGWTRLKLLVALAEANLFEFEAFFDDFYEAYPLAKTHYLSQKTIAILYIKQFERAKLESERENIRNTIQEKLDKTLALNPEDFSLYRLKIAFAPVEEKDRVKFIVLNKILEHSIIPPRRDALYFLELAHELGVKEIKDRWLSKAKVWYPDSRAVQDWMNYGN
ncbi:MAG: hypothetical protein KDK62_06160 [Chlamydiia bacterium]|nr:hypothetical protein [Chlamydiia bacterium]